MTLLAATGITPMRIAGTGLYWIWRKSRPAVFTVLFAVGAIKVTLYIQGWHRRKKWNSVGENIVVLHMFPRGRFCPNMSPFVLKLETYLRMAEVPYEVDFEEPMGPKGKCPWITLNGEEIGDSQMIIEKLGSEFSKDFSSLLTLEQKAVGLSMRVLVEEHLFWCFVMWRWWYDPLCTVSTLTNWGTWLPFHWFYRPIVGRLLCFQAYMQGIGRHNQCEILGMGHHGLETLAVWLGDKPYFMGDEPTEVDCAMFGLLAQIQWNSAGSPYMKMFEGDLNNLSTYCLRMKEKFWPDWNQCLNPIQE